MNSRDFFLCFRFTIVLLYLTFTGALLCWLFEIPWMWVFLKALLPLAAGALVFLILEITFLNLENTREKERLFNQQEESFREILKRGNPDELRVMIDTCYQAALTAASLGDEESCNRYMLWRKDCSEKLRGNANQQRPKVVEPTH